MTAGDKKVMKTYDISGNFSQYNYQDCTSMFT